MLNRINYRRITQIVATALMCGLACFVNYCITQVVTPYFLPLTAILVFVALIYEFNPPIILIIFFGLLDDVMLNGPIGLFVFVYSFLTYLVHAHMRNITNKKLVITIFIILFCLVNVITAKLSSSHICFIK
jgi:cell shape-determining protein MreD